MAWTKKVTTSSGEGRWRVYHYAPDGTQHSKTFKRAGDARRWERDIETRKDKGDYQDPNLGRITFEEMAERYLRGITTPGSVNHYRGELRRDLLPTLGQRRVNSITRADVNDLKDTMEAAGRGGSAWVNVRRLGHAIFERAIEEGRTGTNPFPRAGAKAEPRKVEPLTEAEVAAIAAKVPSRYEALIWTLAIGGLRIGEATALRVRDLDLTGGIVHVRVNAPEVAGHKYLDAPTKTRGSVRDVSIPPSLVRALAGHLNAFSNRFDGGALVFTAEQGGPVRQSVFRARIFKPAARAAKIVRPVRVHDLRHASASIMAAHGFTMVEAAAQLGHSATSMTALYSHSFAEVVHSKAQLLDDVMTSGETAQTS